LVLLVVILALFLSFNRFPKLDAVGGDLDAVNAPKVQCFQGFCIERQPGTTFLSRWWSFSIAYLRLVAVGMAFAFVVAGLMEAFLFPPGSQRGFQSGGMFSRTLKGAALGPVMNLCSACIVPVSSAFHKRAGLEGAIAMVQGSATMNIPALAMVFFVFTPLLGFSRLILAIIGALVIGPIVAMTVRQDRGPTLDVPVTTAIDDEEKVSHWRPVLVEGFRDWAKTSIGYVVRMGPIMVVAGFASGLAIQWLSPETVSNYLGNHLPGVVIAATFGILINVPLLFEIPLVALLLLMGAGTAPAATLLFTAAAGGPVTFWGLAKLMPKRAIAAFAMATWALGAFGGLAVLGIGSFIWAGAMGSDPTSQAAGGSTLFTDATASAGVDFRHVEFSLGETTSADRTVKTLFGDIIQMGGGVTVFDFNSDGFDDIYIPASVGDNALYRNNGDGTFTEVAGPTGVLDPLERGNGGCAADYDNDGFHDLYVTNYGASKLFRNNGNGTFANVTVPAGLDDTDGPYQSTGCAWGDYDQDGYVDLIVVRHLMDMTVINYMYYLIEPSYGLSQRLLARDTAEARKHLELYHNNGDGTFTRVSRLLGDPSPTAGLLSGPVGNLWGAGFQPGWVDLDNDGDLDLYVVNDFGAHIRPNVLWRNDGAGADGAWVFVDISESSSTNVPMYGMGLAVGDYDLDGFLDLYMTNIGHNVLLRNLGDGLRFTDTAIEAEADLARLDDEDRVAWGAVFFDYDNDGDEDLYVVSGFLRLPHDGNLEGIPTSDGGLYTPLRYSPEQPNVLLRNRGDGSFEDVSLESGTDDRGVGRGVAFLDFNNDGCLDLFVVNLGQEARLFQNTCESGNSWLEVETVGTVSNRDGIGARITVSAGGTTQIREVSSGSSQTGQSMMAAHFGLGTTPLVDTVTIRWPSGVVQTLTGVEVNQRLTVIEPH
jgi:uncharacterized membrane protein YraQ (UPF0718 family)